MQPELNQPGRYELNTPPDEVFRYIDARIPCHLVLDIIDDAKALWSVIPCDEHCEHEPMRLERDEAGGFTATIERPLSPWPGEPAADLGATFDVVRRALGITLEPQHRGPIFSHRWRVDGGEG